MMNNATTVFNNKILLPVVAGNIATCYPADVGFVRLGLELGYTILSAGLCSSILKIMYYLELLHTSIDLANDAGLDHPLVT